MVATFEYRRAASVPEAIEILSASGPDAKVLAGGQSLIALINLGLARPSVLVDINGIASLDSMEEVDGELVVGATARHAAALSSATVRRCCPLLAEAMPLIGDRQVRNRGTIGGSVAHADPVAEIPTVATCLGATMRLAGAAGTREVSAADFFVTYLTTAIGEGELLTHVRFPKSPPSAGVSFQELVRRKGDFGIVAAAASVALDSRGACADVRLALAGVDATPRFAAEAAQVLVGHEPTSERIREAARAACADIAPESDIMASGEYRKAMAEVYARRSLDQAVQRAQANARV